LIVISVIVVVPIRKWSEENNELGKARNYYLSFSNWINILQGEAKPDPYWRIDIYVQQPHGTLIIGERIDISGKATVETKLEQNIMEIRIWFQTSQAYNLTFDDEGMINATDSNIHLVRIGDTNKLKGNATICWRLEGSYKPIAQLFFENKTGNFKNYLGISPDVAITVYPESEYAQIVNNEVTIVLAIAVYFLKVIGIISLILKLWNNERSNNSKNYSANSNNNPNKKNNQTNKNIIKSNKGKSKWKKREPQSIKNNCVSLSLKIFLR
jgi:hypothetical protein